MKEKPTVVIVAGGLATRMRPITETIPKCLVDINGKPLIQHQIEFFRDHGYTQFIFCVAHLADKVKAYFADGKQFGVHIEYSEEGKELLGTAGSVGLLKSKLKDTFIVFYGDNLTNEDFEKVMQFHTQKQSDFTVLVRDIPEGYKSSSILLLGKDQKITTFLEKPPAEEFVKYANEKMYNNNGIYIVEPKVLAEIPEGKVSDFAKDIIPKIMKKMHVYGFVSNKFFREIGRTEKYEQFKVEFKGKANVLQ